MNDQDTELTAMATIVGILNGLEEEDARFRVLRYVNERFTSLDQPRVTEHAEPSSRFQSDEGFGGNYSDFASLFDAADPTSGAMRALVAAYWLQVCQGQADFDGQSINKELKHLGHPSKNITSDLSSLMNQTPRLAMQLRKSGRSQQARKTYKLTVEGIRRMKSLLAEE